MPVHYTPSRPARQVRATSAYAAAYVAVPEAFFREADEEELVLAVCFEMELLPIR